MNGLVGGPLSVGHKSLLKTLSVSDEVSSKERRRTRATRVQ